MTRRAPLAALTVALLLTATVACTSDDGAASGGGGSTAPAGTGGLAAGTLVGLST